MFRDIRIQTTEPVDEIGTLNKHAKNSGTQSYG